MLIKEIKKEIKTISKEIAVNTTNGLEQQYKPLPFPLHHLPGCFRALGTVLSSSAVIMSITLLAKEPKLA